MHCLLSSSWQAPGHARRSCARSKILDGSALLQIIDLQVAEPGGRQRHVHLSLLMAVSWQSPGTVHPEPLAARSAQRWSPVSQGFAAWTLRAPFWKSSVLNATRRSCYPGEISSRYMLFYDAPQADCLPVMRQARGTHSVLSTCHFASLLAISPSSRFALHA